MVRARDVASAGACSGWLDVVRKFDTDEATLRIFLTARTRTNWMRCAGRRERDLRRIGVSGELKRRVETKQPRLRWVRWAGRCNY